MAASPLSGAGKAAPGPVPTALYSPGLSTFEKSPAVLLLLAVLERSRAALVLGLRAFFQPARLEDPTRPLKSIEIRSLSVPLILVFLLPQFVPGAVEKGCILGGRESGREAEMTETGGGGLIRVCATTKERPVSMPVS